VNSTGVRLNASQKINAGTNTRQAAIKHILSEQASSKLMNLRLHRYCIHLKLPLILI